MSYIIKDTKESCWLNIDRVVVGCDIVTAVEPVYNYKAATEFSSEETADQMIEQIKSEGQYDTEGYSYKDKTDHYKLRRLSIFNDTDLAEFISYLE